MRSFYSSVQEYRRKSLDQGGKINKQISKGSLYQLLICSPWWVHWTQFNLYQMAKYWLRVYALFSPRIYITIGCYNRFVKKCSRWYTCLFVYRYLVNSYGRLFDFCIGHKLRVINSRSGKDIGIGDFTCITTKGQSVVNHLMVSSMLFHLEFCWRKLKIDDLYSYCNDPLITVDACLSSF